MGIDTCILSKTGSYINVIEQISNWRFQLSSYCYVGFEFAFSRRKYKQL